MSQALTREEMVRRAALKKLKELARERFALRLYEPHPKQLEFHKSAKRLRFAFWGNRCLAADTPVLRPNGMETPISELRPGDEVLAYAEEDGRLVPARVFRVWFNGIRPVYRYVFGRHGREVSVVATKDHKVLSGDRTLVPLEAMRGKSTIASFCHRGFAKLPILRADLVGEVPVYDITIDHPSHMYAIHGGLIVHNCGKTYMGAVEACWFALGNHPYRPPMNPMGGWIVSPSFEVQREVSQKMFLRFLPKENLVNIVWRDKRRGYIDYVVVRSRYGIERGNKKPVNVVFKSVEQGREAFQGPSVPWVWIDEECPMDVFDELLLRTLDCKGSIWGTMTPIVGDMYQRIVEPEPGREDPEAWWSHADWDDNPHLSDDEKRRMLLALPEEERPVRVGGRWQPRTGRVLPEFHEDIHIVKAQDVFPDGEIPAHWRRVAGFDYGMRMPTAFIAAVTDGESVWFVGEHYRSEATPEEHATRVREWIANGFKRIKADPSVVNRTPDGRSVREIYRKLGVPLIPAARGEGSWEYRYELWKHLLHWQKDENGNLVVRPRVFILEDRCPNLVKELLRYRWKESRSGTLHEDTQGDDHAIDAAGYALEDLAPLLFRGRKLLVRGDAVSVEVRPEPHRADWKKLFGEEKREEPV